MKVCANLPSSSLRGGSGSRSARFSASMRLAVSVMACTGARARPASHHPPMAATGSPRIRAAASVVSSRARKRGTSASTLPTCRIKRVGLPMGMESTRMAGASGNWRWVLDSGAVLRAESAGSAPSRTKTDHEARRSTRLDSRARAVAAAQPSERLARRGSTTERMYRQRGDLRCVTAVQSTDGR